MKTKKRKMTIFISCVIILAFCVGCTLSIPSPDIPDYIKEMKIKNSAINPEDIKVSVYFDNTGGMYGFVKNEKNDDVNRNFIIATNKMFDIVTGYNNKASFFKLGRNDNSKYLGWTKIADARTFQTGYTKNEFYEFDNENKNYFEGSMGPLQLLVKDDSIVDYNGINIIITDMAEQSLRGSELAKALNAIMQSRDDYSLSVFAFNTFFNGAASVPKGGVPDKNGNLKMKTTYYEGNRPYYYLMIGPTSEIINLTKSLKESLSEKLKENTDFYSSTILSHNGLEKISTDNFIKTDSLKFLKGIYPTNSNQTVNLFPVENEEIFNNVNEKYPLISYEFDTKYQAKNKNSACLNIMIPILNLSNDTDLKGTEYRINKEKMAFYYTIKGKQPISSIENESNFSNDETSDSSSNATGIKPNKNVMIYKWEEMDSFKFEKIVKTELLVLKKGDIINNAETSDDKSFVKKPIMTVTEENGMLKFRFELLDIKAIPYDYISIYVPIEAKRDLSTVIPPWIESLNLGADPLRFDKTDDLLGFYKVLIGNSSSQAEKDAFQEKQKANIAEIAINIKLKK